MFPETIDVLVDGCQAKNGTLAELSIGYLAAFVKNISPNYFLENSISS